MINNRQIGQKIFHGIVSGAGLTLINILVAFVQIRFILVFLPKELAGIWFLFLSIGLYIGLFDLGVSPTLSREISFILGDEKIDESRKDQYIADLLATSLRIFKITAGAVFFFGLLFGGGFLLWISPQSSRQVVIIAWAIFACGTSLNILGGAAFAALYGLGHVATERTIRAFSLLVWLALMVLSLYLGFGLVGLASSWVIQNFVARIWGWSALRRRHPSLRGVVGIPSMEIMKKIAIPSLKWAAMSLGAILILQTDNVIIAASLGPAAIPSYEAALKIVSTLMTLSLLIVTSSTPFLSRAHAAGNSDTFNSLLMRNIRFGMAFMVILSMFLAVFGDRVINVWLGPNNFVGFPVVWTLLIMLTLEVHHVIHALATMAAGHVIFLKAAIISGILKILISVGLAQYYGLFGVALGTLVAQLLTNNWYAPYVTMKIFGLPLRPYVKTVILPLVVLVIMLGAVNYLIRLFAIQYSDLVTIMLAFPVSAAIGSVIAAFILLTREERQFICSKIFCRSSDDNGKRYI